MLDWIARPRSGRCDEVDAVHLVTNAASLPRSTRWAASRTASSCTTTARRSNDDRLGAIGDIRFVIERARLDDDLLVIAGDNLFEFSLADFVECWRAKGEPASAVAAPRRRRPRARHAVRDRRARRRRPHRRLRGEAARPARRRSPRRATYLFRREHVRARRHVSRRGQRARPRRAASSAGSPSASRSTATASTAPGTTSATSISCSRRTTASERLAGLPERESYSLD